MSERITVADAVARAERHFRSGDNCAQSVLQALQAYYGLAGDEHDLLWQLGTGLGSGMGRRQFVCGAVSGGAAACGLVTALQRASTRDDRDALREETYLRVQELTRRFEAEFGTIECRSLLGCDLLTPEGQASFRQLGRLEGVCIPAIRFVVDSAIEICG